MGNAAVSTGTPCPYPFIFENGTAEPCSKTYGEGLDPGLLIVQVLLESIYLLLILPIAVYRLHKMLTLEKWRKKKHLRRLTQFKVYAGTLPFSLISVLSLVDPKGYRNILPLGFYNILQDFQIGCIMIIGLFFVDFCADSAHKCDNLKAGRVIAESTYRITAVCIMVNFIGLDIVGQLNPRYNQLFRALRFIGGSLILVAFAVISWRAKNKILKVLEAGEDTPTSSTAFRNSCFSCTSGKSDDLHTDKGIRETRKKFNRWFACVIPASMVFLGIGILTLLEYLSLQPSERIWLVAFEDQPSMTHLLVQIFALGSCFLLLHLFTLPKEEDPNEMRSFKTTKGTSLVLSETMAALNDSSLSI